MRRSRLVLVLAAVVALVLVAGCSSGGKKAQPPAPPKPDASGNTPAVLTAGKVSVQSYGPAVDLPKGTAKAIVADTQAYVDAAMTAPYNTGQLSPSYPALFESGGLRAKAVGRDVGVLTDSPVGKAKFTAEATPVNIFALADGSGQFVYLATRFTYRADLVTDAGPIKVQRNVELTFKPDGKKWTVTAYRAYMTRKLPSGATTTTSVASSTGSTP